MTGFLKRIELAWRRLWIRLITAAMRRTADGPPQWEERPHRVLFLRHDRIGDMILSTGALRAIAESHPTITLDVLASPGNAPVLAAEPYVHDVVIFDRRRPRGYPTLIRRLRASRYDAVIDCMVTAPSLTTLMLMWASGAPHRIGIRGRGNDGAFSVTVSQRPDAVHIAEHLATLAMAFGVEPPIDATPRLALSASERATADALWPLPPGARRVLVNVSAGRTFRRWQVDRFIDVVNHLRSRLDGAGVVVIGSPDEWDRVEAVARATGSDARQTPSLRDALALVATANLVFTPDTSIAHAASAFGKPAVAMYVPGTAERWGLFGTWGRSLESPGPTLDSLDPAVVKVAIDEMIEYWRTSAR